MQSYKIGSGIAMAVSSLSLLQDGRFRTARKTLAVNVAQKRSRGEGCPLSFCLVLSWREAGTRTLLLHLTYTFPHLQ
jgi:hypothetical protein